MPSPARDLTEPDPRRKPWTQRMYDLAAEGKYDKDFIIWEILVLVPVGQGARRTLKSRAYQNAKRGHTGREQGEWPRHATKLHRPGQRLIAEETFGQAKRKGRIVVGEDGIVRLRGK